MEDDGPDDEPMSLWPQVTAVSGAAECLAALQGIVPISVATNASASGREMIERALERVGLLRYVSSIFCFTELGYRKSQPEFWHRVQRRLGVPLNRIAMAGDSLENDVLAPRRVGVQAVWFNRGGRRSQPVIPVPMVDDLPDFAKLVISAL